MSTIHPIRDLRFYGGNLCAHGAMTCAVCRWELGRPLELWAQHGWKALLLSLSDGNGITNPKRSKGE